MVPQSDIVFVPNLACIYILKGNEARYFTLKKDTVSNRADDVAPPAPVYNYTDLPDSQYAIPPFVGRFTFILNICNAVYLIYNEN